MHSSVGSSSIQNKQKVITQKLFLDLDLISFH
jgi:hypothetical protein